MVDGEYILANNYQYNDIYKFRVSDGELVKTWYLPQLIQKQKDYVFNNKEQFSYDFGNNVLNGIAYYAPNKTFFLTGKRWDFIYEVKLHDNTTPSGS